MTSVTFDSTQIVNSTYIPQFTKHETAAERDLNGIELALQDGSVLVSTRYAQKTIELKGVLVASSLANLDAAIDTFQELFSRTEKNLDISWNGGTRRYIATCQKLEFDRDFFNTVHVPWEATFVVSKGWGYDPTVTTLSAINLTTTTPATSSFSMLGSKASDPDIKLEGQNFSSVTKGIMFENLDTNEKLIATYNENWSTAGDYIKIYGVDKKVVQRINTVNPEAEINFYGNFPHFLIGTNNFRITAGSIMNQGFDDSTGFGTGSTLTSTNNTYAQSFMVPRRDVTFSGYELYIQKTGSPGNLTVRTESDNGNKPNNSAVSNSSVTFAAASVPTSAAWTRMSTSSSFTLEANTKYWLTFTAAGVDGSNFYTIYYKQNRYALGNASRTTDNRSTWVDAPSDDFGFKVLFGGVAGLSTTRVTVSYNKRYL